MKLDSADSTVIESNLPVSGSVDMTFDVNAMAHLTKLMTNLYNDPMSAVFREYVANGLDAHKVVGQTDPVQVWLPSRDTPMFRVKDTGVGMSMETIRDVYSQYGSSTKNTQNNEIGGFGLGCKSALAISSQFTVESIKDGKKTVAVIHSNEGSVPQLEWLPVQDVDQPNGTTVSIPVHNHGEFTKAATKYFSFFEPGTVECMNGTLGDGRLYFKDRLDSLQETVVGDATVSVYEPLDGYYVNNPIPAGVYIIMGGIVYTIPTSDIQTNLESRNTAFLSLFESTVVVIEAPIGSIKLSPNREGIQFDAATRKYFNELMFSVSDEIVISLSKEFSAAKGLIPAVDLAVNKPTSLVQAVPSPDPFFKDVWSGIIENNQIIFSGAGHSKARNDVYDEPMSHDLDKGYGSSFRFNYRYSPHQTDRENFVVVHGKFSLSVFQNNLKAYNASYSHGAVNYLVLNEDQDHLSVGYSYTPEDDGTLCRVPVPLSDIKKLGPRFSTVHIDDFRKDAAKYRASKRTALPKTDKKDIYVTVWNHDGERDVFESSDSLVESVNASKALVLDNTVDNYIEWATNEIISKYLDDDTVFILIRGSNKKIQNKGKKAVESIGLDVVKFDFTKFYLNCFKDVLSEYTASDIRNYRYISGSGFNDIMNEDHVNMIKDPKIRKGLLVHRKLQQGDMSKISIMAWSGNIYPKLPKTYKEKIQVIRQRQTRYTKFDLVTSINDDYPLTGNFIASSQVDSMIVYLNAQYKENKKKVK